MMTKFLLSLEKLIKNPVSWFDKQSWFLRMVLILTIIPITSAASILGYRYLLPKFDQNSQTNESLSVSINDMRAEMKKYHETEVQELIDLRENISELNRLLKVTSKIDSNENEKLVLGAQTLDSVNENLRQKLKEYVDKNYSSELLNNANNISSLAYIIIDDNALLFSEPTTTSKKITNFDQGAFYPALQENNDWQQIELADGSPAWIEKKYIIIFPINENN